MYTIQEPTWQIGLLDLGSSPYTKGEERSLAEAGYLDGCSYDPLPQQTADAVQPSTEVFWFGDKEGRLGQWAVLKTKYLLVVHKKTHYMCTQTAGPALGG